MKRSDQFSLDAAGQFFDLPENRYEPKLVAKSDFTEINMNDYKMLSEAMNSLNHTFKGGLNEKGTKKTKKDSK
ncbi:MULTISPECIES: hypothetical protein [unclassified Lentimonas]|uniref:hypothetical protein n=1 Tax=unclassified Lentimonas TaxID=2630993 RepID=UPI001321069A|nr:MULTISPECIES: hypothetical protein [unclassified Lentimonas]CAA6692463.1 Unannotated [Lentimonas sp. CC19]CAA6693460.1 Unannotated [Lentimonas sp. CC10]CAA7070789.1 Unannotated [Lentimonas sp. CC11]